MYFISLKSLFRNKRFMLDKMFQQNASKFAILGIQKPSVFFHLMLHTSYFILFSYLMNALVYVDIIKVAQNERKIMWVFSFHIPKIWRF